MLAARAEGRVPETDWAGVFVLMRRGGATLRIRTRILETTNNRADTSIHLYIEIS